MAIEHLTKAPPRQESINTPTSETVVRLLADIQRDGRSAAEKRARAVGH
jgi:sulfopropanediol 3-dehydrogenase